MENIGLYFLSQKNIHITSTLKQSHWSLLFPLTWFSRQSLDRDTMQSILQIFWLSKINLTGETQTGSYIFSYNNHNFKNLEGNRIKS